MITDTFNENMKSDSDADSIQEERTDFKGNIQDRNLGIYINKVIHL